MPLDTLQDLFIEELQDIYSAETQITEALPKMIAAATSSELKQSFELHLKETEGQIKRLDTIFTKLGEDSAGKTCKAMKGLVAEGAETIKEKGNPAVKDAALIAAAQRVEHYEIAAYGTAKTYAQELGHTEVVKLLEATLDEEGETDVKLTRLAEQVINQKALAAA